MKRTFILSIVILLMVGGAVLKSPERANSEDSGMTHTVEKGDTLWDISGSYLGDPGKWPELWERNRYLTNPNYIYPGLEIMVIPPEAVEEEFEYPVEKKKEEVEEIRIAEAVRVEEKEEPILLHLTKMEAYSSGELVLGKPGRVGSMVETTQVKVMFSPGDLIYLDLEKDYPEGTLLGIYRVEGPVYVSGMGKKAYKKRYIGSIKVMGKFGDRYVGMINELFDATLRSDYLKEEIPALPKIVIRKLDDGKRGEVICGAGDNYEFSERDILYIKGGKKEGFLPGDLLNIYMELDELQQMTVNVDGGKTIPKDDDFVFVGKAVVIRVNENFSTVYVIKSLISFNAPSLVVRGLI